MAEDEIIKVRVDATEGKEELKGMIRLLELIGKRAKQLIKVEGQSGGSGREIATIGRNSGVAGGGGSSEGRGSSGGGSNGRGRKSTGGAQDYSYGYYKLRENSFYRQMFRNKLSTPEGFLPGNPYTPRGQDENRAKMAATRDQMHGYNLGAQLIKKAEKADAKERAAGDEKVTEEYKEELYWKNVKKRALKDVMKMGAEAEAEKEKEQKQYEKEKKQYEMGGTTGSAGGSSYARGRYRDPTAAGRVIAGLPDIANSPSMAATGIFRAISYLSQREFDHAKNVDKGSAEIIKTIKKEGKDDRGLLGRIGGAIGLKRGEAGGVSGASGGPFRGAGGAYFGGGAVGRGGGRVMPAAAGARGGGGGGFPLLARGGPLAIGAAVGVGTGIALGKAVTSLTTNRLKGVEVRQKIKSGMVGRAGLVDLNYPGAYSAADASELRNLFGYYGVSGEDQRRLEDKQINRGLKATSLYQGLMQGDQRAYALASNSNDITDMNAAMGATVMQGLNRAASKNPITRAALTPLMRLWASAYIKDDPKKLSLHSATTQAMKVVHEDEKTKLDASLLPGATTEDMLVLAQNVAKRKVQAFPRAVESILEEGGRLRKIHKDKGRTNERAARQFHNRVGDRIRGRESPVTQGGVSKGDEMFRSAINALAEQGLTFDRMENRKYVFKDSDGKREVHKSYEDLKTIHQSTPNYSEGSQQQGGTSKKETGNLIQKTQEMVAASGSLMRATEGVAQAAGELARSLSMQEVGANMLFHSERSKYG